MENSMLAHYGILGMKWGIRRTPEQLARARGKKTSNSDGNSDAVKSSSKTASSGKGKSVSEMSDSELRERLNRINMEDQYNAAMARRNPEKFQRAKRIVSDLAEQTVRNVASKAINKTIEKFFADKEPITNYRNVDISKLSDKALASALKRANMEKSLSKILSDERTQTSAAKARQDFEDVGRAVVDNILALPAPREDDRR